MSTNTQHKDHKKLLISRELVEKVVASGNKCMLRALAMALKIKYSYSSSAVWNPNYKRLAELTGLSPKTCKTYLNLLKDVGLARYENDDKLLILSSLLDKTSERSCYKSFRITIRDFHTIRNIEDLIKCTIASYKDNCRRNHATRRKTATRRVQGHKYLKFKMAMSKIERKSGRELQHHDELGLSYCTLAMDWNESTTTAQRRINRLIEAGIIRKYRNLEVLYYGKDAPLRYMAMLNGEESKEHYPLDYVNHHSREAKVRFNVPKKIFLNSRQDCILASYSNTYTFNSFAVFVHKDSPQFHIDTTLPQEYDSQSVTRKLVNVNGITTEVIDNLALFKDKLIDITGNISHSLVDRSFPINDAVAMFMADAAGVCCSGSGE